MIKSLERMVIDFAKDRGSLNELQIQSISQQVKTGDITAVLKHYEEDIKSPIRSTLTSDLLRSLLIQLQKAKVDGELAMSALDKLLRSNELNFAFLAFMPTLGISYWGAKVMVSWFSQPTRPKTLLPLQLALLDIERTCNILATTEASALYHGQLLCDVAQLRPLVSRLSKPYRLLRDIQDLEYALISDKPTLSSDVLAIVQRMWKCVPRLGL